MASISVDTSVNQIPSAANWSNSGVSYTAGTYVFYSTSATDDFNGVWLCTANHTSSASNNPAVNSPHWTRATNGPVWLTNSKALALSYLSTYTHDKFTGSVWSNDTGVGTLLIQQSGDGVNWDVSEAVTIASATSYTKYGDSDLASTSGYGVSFSKEILLPYIRIIFKYNGSNPPTTFRLFSRAANSGVKY